MLEDTIFDALKQIVGEDNISKEPAILDGYAWQWCNEVENTLKGKEPTRFGQRPDAVILPCSPEEVQAIVKLCNAHDVKYKALSTGQGAWAGVTTQRAIQIDLRRMNRILKIDPDNMYAVIEPYVTNAQLQAELIKYGLIHNAQGGGPQTSPLASHTSFVGPSFTSAHTGYSGRNLLGAEWILPTGELLKVGSFDHVGEWFTGDGPGFSIRGVFRGAYGAYGGLGVFTKCAIRLFTLPLPEGWEWKMTGTIPNHEWNLPSYWKMFVLNFPDWEKFEDAFYEVNDHNVSMMAMASSAEGLASMFTNTKADAIDAIFAGLLMHTKRYFVVMLTAHTEREFNYRTKLIKAIMVKHDGEDLIEKGIVTPMDMHYAEGLRNSLGNHAFRFTSCFQSTHGGLDTIAMSVKICQINLPIKQKYIEKRVIGDDRGEGMWITGYEGGHLAHAEIPTVYDPASPESCRGYAYYQDECNKADIEQALGIPFFIVGDDVHDYYGPNVMNYQNWLRKIKAALDPNEVSDPGHYVSAKK